MLSSGFDCIAAGREAVAWIEEHLSLRESNSAEFWYERMASQSARSLPVIYQPFDGRRRGHFVDRAQILDYASVAGDGRLLDFGPGDGWPSLMVAAFAREVVGLDASPRRVAVCRENADRLGIDNVQFIHVAPDQPLPFEDESFDGAMAASSVEQTPDPLAVLREIRRVLKPGARLRVNHEGLLRYAGGQEYALALVETSEHRCALLVMERLIEQECVRHFGLMLDLDGPSLKARLSSTEGVLSVAGLSADVLSSLQGVLLDAVTWTTRHPCTATMLRWLEIVGFSQARATHEGGRFASRLYDVLGPDGVPRTRPEVDRMFRPVVDVLVDMDCPEPTSPTDAQPSITAIR